MLSRIPLGHIFALFFLLTASGLAQPPELFINDRNHRDQGGPGSPLFDFSVASHLNEADQLKATYGSDAFSPYIASLQVGTSYYVYLLDFNSQNLCALQYLSPGHYSAPVCIGVGAPPGDYCCGTESLVLHPDGTKLYVLVNFQNIVQVDIRVPNYTELTVNPNTLRLTKTGGGIAYASKIGITPDGKRLLAGGHGRLYDADIDAVTGLMNQIQDVPVPGSVATGYGPGIHISPNPAKPVALYGDSNGDGVYIINLVTLRISPTSSFERIAGPPGLGTGHDPGNNKIYYGDMVFHESGNYAYAASCGSVQCVLTGVGLIDVVGKTLTIQGGSPPMVAYSVQYNPSYHRLYVGWAFNVGGIRTFKVSAAGSVVTFDTSYIGGVESFESMAVPQIPSTMVAPDLTAIMTDNVSGATTLGNKWTWNIHIANGGNGPANFTNGATILVDRLPSMNIGYGSASTPNPVGITRTINCMIASNTLTCTANGAVTIAAGGSIDVSFQATPTAIGSFANPPATNSSATTAGVVYGQRGSFTTNTPNNGGVSANSLNQTKLVALDSSGNLYVTDISNHRVLYYPAGSTTATRVYGQGGSFTSNTPNNGGVSADSLYFPQGVALDSSANLYVADTSNNRVLYYLAGSTTATRVYGQGGSSTSNTGNKGGFSANSLFGPVGVALDSSGNLYVTELLNNRVLYYPAGSTTATRVFGQGGSFTTVTANTGGVHANSLFGPYGVALGSSGNLYVADASNHRVLFYPAGSTTATRVYGQSGNFTTNDLNNGGDINNGGLSANSLFSPLGVALDSSGNLYVADGNNNRVLYYPAGNTTAMRVYGQGGSFTSNTMNKGGLGASSIFFPFGVALDGSGNLYVSDYGNKRVLKYNGNPAMMCAVDPGNVVMESNESNNSCSDTVNVVQATVQVTVGTNINGPKISVDGGTAFTASQTFTWNIGSSHSLSTSTPQAAGMGKQYVWQTWSDTGAISHSVTAAANTTRYTANFKTQ